MTNMEVVAIIAIHSTLQAATVTIHSFALMGISGKMPCQNSSVGRCERVDE